MLLFPPFFVAIFFLFPLRLPGSQAAVSLDDIDCGTISSPSLASEVKKRISADEPSIVVSPGDVTGEVPLVIKLQLIDVVKGV